MIKSYLEKVLDAIEVTIRWIVTVLVVRAVVAVVFNWLFGFMCDEPPPGMFGAIWSKCVPEPVED
jgi:hypothetical protein